MQTLVANGADVIELGVPFSDPKMYFQTLFLCL
jgi:tryptophan synthase alpha subunit